MRQSLASTIMVAVLLMAGCATHPGPGAQRPAPPEYQDPRTGVTVTRVDKPLIFELEGSQRASGAGPRDYVTAMAAATNRAGTLRYLLLVYVWSAELAGTTPAGHALVMTADDRRVSFESVPMAVVEADLSMPIPAPAGVGPLWGAYATDLATLTSLASAQRLTMEVSDEPEAQRFELWDDQRAALDRFVRYLNGE